MGTDDKRWGASDRRIGQRFGDYLIEDQIGRGGMGVVFRARHAVTGQTVALKLMAPDLADNHAFRDRFILEAEAGPNLGHPNIVPVYESGDADGELFIAMELIEGTDLKGLIKQEGRLDPKRVLSIFRQAASALDAAHESGMVHRDVKPQNILVVQRETPDDDDRVYVTDFGLVRPLASETSASRTGQVFGSVAYMAPELIEGIPADGRADVYALGCVLYECLTGSVPFERDNEVSAVWAHIHEDPPLLTDKCPDLPGGLNDVVLKAMQKHPDDRFLTCGEFITDFELGLGRKLSALKHSYVRPLVARIPRRKSEREVWAPNFFPELSRVRAASRERFDWRKAVALAASVAILASVQIGRDGGLPEAVADVADAADSFVESVIDPKPEPAAQPEAAGRETTATDRNAPESRKAAGEISPNSRERLKALLPAEGPTEPAETDDPSSGEPGDPPDPGKIAFARGDVGALTGTTPTDIWIMDVDGSDQTNLTKTQADEFYPSWSPDGRHLAYTKLSNGGPLEIWVMNADGTDQRDLGLCPGDVDCGKLAWSPNGRHVAYAQGTDLYVADLTTGTRRLVTGGLKPASRPGQEGGPGPTWSPNGRRLAYVCGDSLCVIAARGGEPRVIGPALTDIEWSPTGPWIVGEAWTGDEDDPQSSYNLFVTRADGTERRQLTFNTGPQGGPRKPGWALDGNTIVYTGTAPAGPRAIFRINFDGTGRVQLTNGPDDYTPDWGPSL